MRTKRRETMRLRALLVALTATSCCCMLVSGGTTTSAVTPSNPNNSVISNLLLRRGDQAPQTTTTTNNLNAGSVTPPENPTTTTTTTIETKVPSISPSPSAATPITQTIITTTTQSPAQQKPASQQLAQQQQQPTTTTTSQFQYVRPVTAAVSVPQASPTTTTTTIRPPQELPAACQHNNRTYALGQTWNVDCLEVCECVSGGSGLDQPPAAIVACKPRCPIYPDPPGDNCKLLRSEQDGCCLEWKCALGAKFAPGGASPTTGDFLTSNSRSIVQTERGELSVSTTEIRMPTTTTTTTTTTAAPTTTTTTTVVATTTTQPPATTPKPVPLPPQTASPRGRQLTLATTTTSASRPREPASTRRPTTAGGPPFSNARGGRGHALGNGPAQPPARPLRPADMTRSVDGSMPVAVAGMQQQPPPSVDVDAVPQVDPTTLDLCISNADGGGPIQLVNTTWLVPKCNKPCRCVFRDEPINRYTDFTRFVSLNLKLDSLPTEIRCGLPAECPQINLPLVASSACPKPQLRWPVAVNSEPLVQDQESCACPEIVCERSLPTPTQKLLVPSIASVTTTLAPTPSVGCKHSSGRLMSPGETFYDECHSICRCTPENKLRCEQLQCPSEPPSDHLCLAWALADANFRPNSTDNKCCPEFVCKEPVPTTLDLNGTTSTTTTTTTTTTTGDQLVVVEESSKPPSTTTAATTTAEVDQEPLSSSKATKFKSCVLLGKQYAHDERLPEQIQGRPSESQDPSNASSDTCERVCNCEHGEIVCKLAPCAPLSDAPPVDLECPASLAYKLTEECCPRWACQVSPPDASDSSPPSSSAGLQDIQIQQVNSSAVEIVIKLPEFADKQPGILVLNYTNLPLANPDSLNEEPPAYAHWVRRPTKTSNGTLSALIKYYLTGLRPASRYWVRFAVLFGKGAGGVDLPLDEPLESMTHSFTMPAATDDDLEELTSTIGTTTTTKYHSPPPTRTITPKSSTTRAPVSTVASSSSLAATTSTTTTTTTTTTPRPPVSTIQQHTNNDDLFAPKPSVDEALSTTGAPCAHDGDNRIDGRASNGGGGGGGVNISPHQPWGEYLHHQVQNAAIQRYAWHLLVAFSVMTILFTIVSYLYFKKSSRMIAPITSPYHHHNAFHQQSAYDNPTFTTKLVSYNANQPRVLLVDESYQNLDNLAKQKNMEVDKSSPLHHHHHHHKNNNNSNNNGHHTTTMIQHQNGRQHLI